ncbi:hypothetical protein CEXT_232271 [Caerostris extrusa]|uniref:Uncharacterized protein n=1 Tax=Caerostris extrusa TaxID=172846 RepID=A0AAV4XTK0_CAEEX|nr:hypothetical protein CEXT_232271 [Caerostris extrusa]
MSVATPCVLSGFQQTIDRRNFISYATHPSESSVNCEKYSKDQSLGGAACTSQNMDAPQERKNPPYESTSDATCLNTLVKREASAILAAMNSLSEESLAAHKCKEE